MWSRRRWIVGVLALAAGCSAPPQRSIPAGAVVLALGDSITAGFGVGADAAWPARLAALSGWQVVNAGVSGDTSAGGLERLPGLLSGHRPTAVLVELGGNDMLRRVPDEQVAARLGEIVAGVRAAGAVPVLVAAPRPNLAGALFGTLQAASFYKSLATREGIHLVEEAMPKVLGDAALKLDPLHPNAAGHAVLAMLIADELRRAGLLR